MIFLPLLSRRSDANQTNVVLTESGYLLRRLFTNNPCSTLFWCRSALTLQWHMLWQIFTVKSMRRSVFGEQTSAIFSFKTFVCHGFEPLALAALCRRHQYSTKGQNRPQMLCCVVLPRRIYGGRRQ